MGNVGPPAACAWLRPTMTPRPFSPVGVGLDLLKRWLSIIDCLARGRPCIPGGHRAESERASISRLLYTLLLGVHTPRCALTLRLLHLELRPRKLISVDSIKGLLCPLGYLGHGGAPAAARRREESEIGISSSLAPSFWGHLDVIS